MNKLQNKPRQLRKTERLQLLVTQKQLLLQQTELNPLPTVRDQCVKVELGTALELLLQIKCILKAVVHQKLLMLPQKLKFQSALMLLKAPRRRVMQRLATML